MAPPEFFCCHISSASGKNGEKIGEKQATPHWWQQQSTSSSAKFQDESCTAISLAHSSYSIHTTTTQAKLVVGLSGGPAISDEHIWGNFCSLGNCNNGCITPHWASFAHLGTLGIFSTFENIWGNSGSLGSRNKGCVQHIGHLLHSTLGSATWYTCAQPVWYKRYPIYICVHSTPDRMCIWEKYIQCANLVHLGNTWIQN